jgi:hypothetical protein
MRYVAILLTLLLFSCKKENDPSPIFVNQIKAGKTNAGTMTYDTLDPSVMLTMVWDAQNLYAYGSDSIDINDDGSYDFVFTSAHLNPDSLHLLNGQMPNPFPYFRVDPRNGYSVRMKTENVYVGLGQVYPVYWADSLNFDDVISVKDSWSGSAINLWGENPQTNPFMSFGPWYACNKTMYIGFNRLNKLGWIEVDATDRLNIVIKSYSFQN